MSEDVKRLLAVASPLPWHFEDDEYLHGTESLPHYGTQLNWDLEGLGGVWRNDYDKALIEHAVNHLPDYEAVVEALIQSHEYIWTRSDSYHAPGAEPESGCLTCAALVRLREKVPA